LLAFENVTLHRGGRLLFERLDLMVGAGEALHLTGPNGVGKSSLIRLAAGLLKPAAGTIKRSTLALADDQVSLDPDLPLRSALGFWTKLAGTDDRLHDAMAALALGHLADVPVRLLSTGQGKRATLARVAASGAPLWLLDEPLNGLDADGMEGLGRLISGHRASGGAVVAASHLPLSGTWSQLDLHQ
jgi:heme exporter protein A